MSNSATARYFACIGRGRVPVRTFAEALEYAEAYGTTAERCDVETRHCLIVASFRRDPNGDGTRWYRAEVSS